MALIASVVKDKRKGEKAGRVDMAFTAPDGHVYYRTLIVASGLDALTVAQSIADKTEDNAKEAELEYIFQKVLAGAGIPSVPRHVTTLARARRYVWRSIAELMHDEDDFTRLINTKRVAHMFARNTDEEIAAELKGVQATDVAVWRAQIVAFVAAVNGYSKSIPRQEDK